MKHIYCVVDDSDERELLIFALKTVNYEVSEFSGSKCLMEKLKYKAPDLILLDIMIQEPDGITILNNLKNDTRYKNIPVIIVTAASAEEVKVKCLDLGADDFVTKPFGVLELIARINAVLRSSRKSADEYGHIELNGIVLDYRKREVRYKNNYVDLNYKELELFYFLIMNKGVVLSRDKIIKKIWGNEFRGRKRTVSTYINSIRYKLDAVGCNDIIKTVRSAGYKFEDKF